MKKSLQLLDDIIEKAKYDNFKECKKEGEVFENFYVFNLKLLRELMQEEFNDEKAKYRLFSGKLFDVLLKHLMVGR